MTTRKFGKGLLGTTVTFMICLILVVSSAFAAADTTGPDTADTPYVEEVTEATESAADETVLSDNEDETAVPGDETESIAEDEDETAVPESEEDSAPPENEEESAAISDEESVLPAEDQSLQSVEESDSDISAAVEADIKEDSSETEEPVTETAETEKETEKPEPKPYAMPLKNGTYYIVTKLNPFMALQPEDSSTANGKAIDIKGCDGSTAQRFKLVADTKTGYYTITNVLSGKALAVKGNTAKSGTAVVQNTSSTALGQKWVIVKKGSYYMFRSALNGTPLYLTMKGGSAVYGTDTVIQGATNTSSQLFRIEVAKASVTVSDGVYEIASSQNNNLVLDITSGNIADRSNVQLFTSNGGASQKFIIKKVSGDVYTITGYKSGKAVEIKGGSTAKGTNVQLFTKSGGPGQMWRIRNAGDGTLYFTNYKSGLPLEVCGGKAYAKANIIVYNPSGNTGQKFVLKKVADSQVKPIADGVYQIKSKSNSKYVVAVEDASRLQRANIQMQNNKSASFQKFKITYSGCGYYTIQSVRSKHVLEVSGGSYGNQVNIWQYQNNKTLSQLWLPHKNSDGSYSFINAKTSKVLNIAGTVGDCANIQTTALANANAQRFTLTKTTGSDSTAVDYGKAKNDPVLSEMCKKAQGMYSDTNYLVLANITKHRLVLFKEIEDRWISVLNSPISVGKASTPTPTGTFYVYNHWKYFDGDYNEDRLTYQCWWSTCFYGSYYFHSVLYDYNSGYPGRLRDGRMEVNVSHGCVRMPLENAEYLYDHSPIGTKVKVYK